MPGFLVVLFWCWVGVSVVILLRRAIRKTIGRHASTQPPETSPLTWPPLHEIGTVPASNDSHDTPQPDHEPATTTSTSSTATAVDTARRATTLPAALEGIRLPCDLAPLTSAAVDFQTRAVFTTGGYPAEVVAPALADELERIGMTFHAVTDNTAIAERDGTRVRVSVRSVGASVNGVTDLVYPTAPENSVIVELELE
ncbi:MAG TPA: hypothetical protein VF183_12545 [Acidimicrobiales bacterium]